MIHTVSGGPPLDSTKKDPQWRNSP